MKLSVIYQPTVPASTSPYRVRDEQGRELDWANAFLDGQRIRQLSTCSLRIYAYDLLDFARWFELQHQPLAEITESTLVDYVRHQLLSRRLGLTADPVNKNAWNEIIRSWRSWLQSVSRIRSFHRHRMRSESEGQFTCAPRLPVKSALP